MANPILVEVTRGGRVESIHRGAIAVVDDTGDTRFSAGEIDIPVFPRSAVKAIQALALVECGAADAFGFGARELALAQSSHGGEPMHVEGVAAMLAAMGLDASALECGVHSPFHRSTSIAMKVAGTNPSALNNNCSGKHAGFLAVARHLGHDVAGYVQPGHPVQMLVRDVLAQMTGEPLSADICGTDGCSIPTYGVPLAGIASGFARLASRKGLGPERAAAAQKVMAAALAHPELLGTTGQFAVGAMAAMAAVPGGALVKSGAEGVYIAAIPAVGLGVALKIDDGGQRGAETAMAGILSALFPDAAKALYLWANGPINTVRGERVGDIRATDLSISAL